MKTIILILCIFLVGCTSEVCNEKIICEDGREFPAESYNQETKQCEPLFYTGGTPCFNENDCSNYNYDNCPEECQICPPCEACSSLVCGTKEFCNNLGFDQNWSESIKTI